MLPPGSSASDPNPAPAAKAAPLAAPSAPRDVSIPDSLPPEAGILRYASSVTISHKSPEQLAHDQEMERLKELNKQESERRGEEYRRQVDTRNWVTGIVVTTFMAAIACLVMFLPGATEETRKWAFGYLFAIFTYWMGYIGGRGGKEPPKSSE